MTRTEGDSWDLASSVGATATMVAAARAAATRRPQPVITDQFAEPLVRAVGLDVFTKLASGELDSDDVERGIGFPRMTDIFAARARYYDEYFAEATAAGVQQVGGRSIQKPEISRAAVWCTRIEHIDSGVRH
jgi:O-methyltransferase involved in polyketide biosynthesis